SLMLRYVEAAVAQFAQTAACNSIHSIEQRCCRWLLIAHDSAGSDSFAITHEVLAMMLGVQRASVSIAANALQKAGIIEYRHGRVTVTDRRALEARACECYAAIRAHFDDLLHS
ncbi:MAG TPA: helix-turn-helix domain-containing protein, partial [Stellaceae bacterium]